MKFKKAKKRQFKVDQLESRILLSGTNGFEDENEISMLDTTPVVTSVTADTGESADVNAQSEQVAAQELRTVETDIEKYNMTQIDLESFRVTSAEDNQRRRVYRIEAGEGFVLEDVGDAKHVIKNKGLSTEKVVAVLVYRNDTLGESGINDPSKEERCGNSGSDGSGKILVDSVQEDFKLKIHLDQRLRFEYDPPKTYNLPLSYTVHFKAREAGTERTFRSKLSEYLFKYNNRSGLAQGQEFFPEVIVDRLADLVENEEYTELQVIHFLAQSYVETQGFTLLQERNPFLSNDDAYFSKKYANHPNSENGDVASRDGSKFRGRGYIHLTHRYGFRKFSEYQAQKEAKYYDANGKLVVDVDCEDYFLKGNNWELVTTNKEIALEAGLYFYKYIGGSEYTESYRPYYQATSASHEAIKNVTWRVTGVDVRNKSIDDNTGGAKQLKTRKDNFYYLYDFINETRSEPKISGTVKDDNSDPFDIYLTKRKLTELNYVGNDGEPLELNGEFDDQLSEAIKRFQRAMRRSDSTPISGEITKDSPLWDPNAAVFVVGGAFNTGENTIKGNTSDYVFDFINEVEEKFSASPYPAWVVTEVSPLVLPADYSDTTFDVKDPRKGLHELRSFQVSTNKANLEAVLSNFLSTAAETRSEYPGGRVRVSRVYVSKNTTITPISGIEIIQSDYIQDDGALIFELFVDNLKLSPSLGVINKTKPLFQTNQNDTPPPQPASFSLLKSVDNYEPSPMSTTTASSAQSLLSPVLNVSLPDYIDSSALNFDFGDFLNYNDVLYSYLDDFGENATYKGMEDAIKGKIDSLFGAFLSSTGIEYDVDVHYKESNQTLNFDVKISKNSTSDSGILFDAISAVYQGDFPLDIEVAFMADFSFGVNLEKFHDDPENCELTLSDTFFTVRDLGLSVSIAKGTRYDDPEDSSEEAAPQGFSIGDLTLKASINELEFFAAHKWNLTKTDDTDGSGVLTFADIQNGAYEWSAETIGSLNGELELTAEGDAASGSAVISLSVPNIFEDITPDISIEGQITVQPFDFRDGLISLGTTVLTFDSTTSTVDMASDSASMRIGDDLLSVDLTDISGSYNYQDNVLDLDIDSWVLKLKGLVEASGTNLQFDWREDAQPGDEILTFADISATFLPLNKTLEITDLSIRNNGFSISALPLDLPDQINLGIVSLQGAALQFNNFNYTKDSSGTTVTTDISLTGESGSVSAGPVMNVSFTGIEGNYSHDQKAFTLSAQETDFRVGPDAKPIIKGTITKGETAPGLSIFHKIDGNTPSDAEVLWVEGEIELEILKLNGSGYELITVAPDAAGRSLSVSEGKITLGSAQHQLTEEIDFGLFTLQDINLRLNGFQYNRKTEEFRGKVGLTAKDIIPQNSSSLFQISFPNSGDVDSAELWYDLENGDVTGNINGLRLDVLDFLTTEVEQVQVNVKDGSFDSLVLNSPEITATLADEEVTLRVDRIAVREGKAFVTLEGIEYDTSLEGDRNELFSALLNGGDDDLLLVQEKNDQGQDQLVLKDRTTGNVARRPIVLSEAGNDIEINLGAGYDKLEIASDLNLGGKNLIVISEEIKVEGESADKTKIEANSVTFNADSSLDISAMSIAQLLIDAFGSSAGNVQINYDTLVNRLLGRANSLIQIDNADITATTTVSFSAKAEIKGESTGILPVDLGDKIDKIKIPGLTTALAAVDASAVINILDSVISGNDLQIISDAKVQIKNSAVSQGEEEEEQEGSSEVYDAVVALSIVKSTSSVNVERTNLKINGNILVKAVNRTDIENLADGISDNGTSAYGGSFGILYLSKETTASIGTGVTFSDQVKDVTVIADSSSEKITNKAFAAAGGAQENNSDNAQTLEENDKTSGCSVNIAGAAAVTIVNSTTTASFNPGALQNSTIANVLVDAKSLDNILSSADGTTVDENETDVGAAVAVGTNVVTVTTEASVENVRAKDVVVNARSKADITADAVSGAGGETFGAAGSVAINVLDVDTEARVGSALVLDGKLALLSDAEEIKAKARALPRDIGASGKVGIGASFALNDLEVNTDATDSGASLSGTVTSLDIKANTKLDLHSETKAGSSSQASSGAAISPSAALNIVNSKTKSDHSASISPVVVGDVTVSSTSFIGAVTKARASADGNVAIGASIGISVINADNTAEVGSDLSTNSGNIDITASNTINSFVDVEAAPRAEGDNDENADDEADRQMENTRVSPDDRNSAKGNSVIDGQSSSVESEGGDNSKRIGISAAVGVNVIKTGNAAAVVNGADIAASGDVTVRATEDVDAVTQAVTQSVEDTSGAKVGAGVGVNVVNKANRALISDDSVVEGNNLIISAETADQNKSAILAAAAGVGENATVSVTAGVNYVNSITEASLGSSSVLRAQGTTAISAENQTDIQTLALAAGVSQESAGIGAALAINVIKTDVTASAAGNLNAKSDFSVTAVNDMTSQGHQFTPFGETFGIEGTAVAAAGGVSQGSAAISGSTVINVFDTDTRAAIESGTSVNTESGFSGGDLTIEALSTTDILNVAGSLGVSGGAVGLGLAADITILDNQTMAAIEQGTVGTPTVVLTGGTLSVNAVASDEVTSVVATASVSDSAAVGATTSVINVKDSTVKAVIGSEENAQPVTVVAGNVSVAAQGDITIRQVVSGVSASGSASVGGAAAIVVHDGYVKAAIGDRVTVTSTTNDVSVAADAQQDIVQVAGIVAAGGTAGVAGTTTVSVLNERTEASIGESSVRANQGSIYVQADDTTKLAGVTGFVGAGGSAGVGVGANINTVTKNTVARVGKPQGVAAGGTTIVSAVNGDVVVDAQSTETIIGVAAGIAAGTAGVGVNASVHTYNLNTTASVGNQAVVFAKGSVIIDAKNTFELNTVTAGISAGTAGVGLGAAVTVVDQNTDSSIGSGASVTALGFLTGRDISRGTFGKDEGTDRVTASSPEENDDSEVISQPQGLDFATAKEGALNGSDLFDTGRLKPLDPETPEGGEFNDEINGAMDPVDAADRSYLGFKGLSVSASNNTDLMNIVVGLGAGAAGVSLNAGVAVVNASADASVENDAIVNQNILQAADGQKVLISAGNNFNYMAVATSLGFGVAGIAPAANIAVAKLTTNATVGESAVVNANGDVEIVAETHEKLLGMCFGVAGGFVGVGGSAQVIKLDTTTDASVDRYAEIRATGDFRIAAIDNTKVTEITGAMAGGFVGAGAAVGVLTLTKQTAAQVDGKIEAANVEAEADSNETLFQLVVAGAGGFVGVGGGVSITIVDVDARVAIGIHAEISATNDITIKAVNSSQIDAFSVGVGGGFVGVGGAVSYGRIVGDTTAVVDGTLNAGNNIQIEAERNNDLNVTTASGAAGAVGVQASVSSWAIGSDNITSDGSGEYESDAIKDEDSPDSAAGEAMTSVIPGDDQSGVPGLLGGRPDNTNGRANTSAAMGSARTEMPDGSSLGLSGAQTVSPAGISAVTGTQANLTAGGNIVVSSDGNIDVVQHNGSFSASAVSLGASVAYLKLENSVNASLGGTVTAQGDVSVTADLCESVTGNTFSGKLGFVGTGALVGVVKNTSTVRAAVAGKDAQDNLTTVTAGKIDVLSVRTLDISLQLSAFEINAIAVGAGVANVEVGSGTNDISTDVGTGAVLNSSGELNIESHNSVNVKNEIGAAGVSGFGLSGYIARSVVDSNAQVNIGNQAELYGKDVLVQTVGNHNQKNSINTLSVTVANIGASVSSIENTSDARVLIDGVRKIKGDKVTIRTENNFGQDSEQGIGGHDIRGRSYNLFAGVNANRSETRIGTAANRFASEITIIDAIHKDGGGIEATSQTQGQTGVLNILALTNILSHEVTETSSASGLGTYAGARSRGTAYTLSKVTLDNSELLNESGEIIISALTNATVFVQAHSKAISGFESIAQSNAVNILDVANDILIRGGKIQSGEITISAGKIGGYNKDISGYSDVLIASADAVSYSASVASKSDQNASMTAKEANNITIEESAYIFGADNVNLSAVEGLPTISKSEIKTQIGLKPDISKESVHLNIITDNDVAISPFCEIRAGSNSAATLHLLSAEQMAGVDENNSAEIRARLLEILSSKGRTDAPDPDEELVIQRLQVGDISVPIEIDTIVKKENEYYKFTGYNLLTQNYEDSNNWVYLGDDDGTYMPSGRFYTSSIEMSSGIEGEPGNSIPVSAPLNNGMVVLHQGKFYRRTGGINLEAETYTGNEAWEYLPDHDPNSYDIEYNIARQKTEELQNQVVLVRSKDLAVKSVELVDYANLLVKQREEIISWMREHKTNADATARYEAQLLMIDNQLSDLPSTYEEFETDQGSVRVYNDVSNALLISFGDINRSSGHIIIDVTKDNAESDYTELVRSGVLVGGAGASVDAYNETPLAMNFSNINLNSNTVLKFNQDGNSKTIRGGGVYVNCEKIVEASEERGVVKITQDYLHNDFAGYSDKLITDVFINGKIHNDNGSVEIKNRIGAININSEIAALDQEILSRHSVNINVTGFYMVGANPVLQTGQAVSGNGSIWERLRPNDTILEYDSIQAGIDGNDYFNPLQSDLDGDVNQRELFLRSGGVVRAQGNITIVASHINVNGSIESGVTDLSVEIKENGEGVIVETRSDGLLSGDVESVISDRDRTVELRNIVTRGGSITLAGDIFNTSIESRDKPGGNIKVAHGYANVSVTNDSDYNLVINGIDTTRKNEGKITIIDTAKVNESNEKENKKTVYSYDGEKITVTSFTQEFDEEEELYRFEQDVDGDVEIAADHTVYTPQEGLYMIWTEGQATRTQHIDKYEKKSFNLLPDFIPGADNLNDWVVKDSKHVSHRKEVLDKTPLVKSRGLFRLSEDMPVGSQERSEYDLLVNKGIITVGEQETLYSRYFGDYRVEPQGEDGWNIYGPFKSGGGWLSPEVYTTTTVLETGTTDYFNHYLHASNDIGIDFSGGNPQTAIDIKSNGSGNVYLQGNILTPENSTMVVNAENQVVTSDSIIFSGVTPEINNASGDLVINHEISSQPLVLSATGNVTINAIRKEGSTQPLIIESVRSINGNVTINSATGIVAHNSSSIISGNTVFLNAKDGGIGYDSNYLRVDTNTLNTNSGGFSAHATGGIFVKEVAGDLELIRPNPKWPPSEASVKSVNGNVGLRTTNGSIINGISSTFDTRNVSGHDVFLYTGGEGSIPDLKMGDHESLHVNSAGIVSVSSEADLRIGKVATLDSVTLAAVGNITDIGTEQAAVLAAGGLALSAQGYVGGADAEDSFNVQLGVSAALSVEAAGSVNVNQVAADGMLRGETVVTDGITVQSARSDESITISTQQGDLRLHSAAAPRVALNAAGNIFDSREEGVEPFNIDTSGATGAQSGDIHLEAGAAIGRHDGFLQVKTATGGHLSSHSGTDSFINAMESIRVASAVSDSGSIILRVNGDAVVSHMAAAHGTAAVDAAGSLYNCRTDDGDAVSARTIVLNAQTGTIGTSEKAFAVDSTNGTITAEAELEVFLSENEGIMNLNSVVSSNSEVVISAPDGMVDANENFHLGLEHFGLADLGIDKEIKDLNVAATVIRLISSRGGIGTLADALETDVYGERTGRIHAEAKDDIALTEIIGSMNTGTIISSDGSVSAGTRDTALEGEDLFLDEESLVRAYHGDVYLRSGDDLYHLSGAVVIAGHTVYVYGDHGNADAGIGSDIVIQGSVSAGLIRIAGEDDNDTVLLDVRDDNTVKGRVEVYGGRGDDTIRCVSLDTEQIHLYGQEDDDAIIANSMTNRVHVYGGGGNDFIRGGQAGDILFGGAGDDRIFAGGGTNFIFGDGGQVIDGSIIVASEKTGSGKDTVYGSDAGDVIIGDNGNILVSGLYNHENTMENLVRVETSESSLGDDDRIYAGAGSDLLIGGSGADAVYAAEGDDIAIGDNGSIVFENIAGRSFVETVTNVGENTGGSDWIDTGSGSDVVLGGAQGDTIDARNGKHSILIGDNGSVTFDNSESGIRSIREVTSGDINVGENDVVMSGSGDDVIIGGTGSDNISAGDGSDIVLGDNGTVLFTDGELDLIRTTIDHIGGNDTIEGGSGDKIVLGGFGDDVITTEDGSDLIFGDGGYVSFDKGVLLEANANGVKSGGNDRIDAGTGANTVIGGLGDDVITTGTNRQSDSSGIRDAYSDDTDVVIGDNGRQTFNGTGVHPEARDGAVLSFNFQGQAAKGIDAGLNAGAPESRVENWMNIQSNGPGTYGNDPTEMIVQDNGQRLDGLYLSWGGKESHRTDSIELHNYQMENYNPEQIRDPLTGQLIPGDGYLFGGGMRTSAPNSQCDNKLEVEMAGLNKYFREYSVIVYIDAPKSISSLIQNPQDSTLGSIYGAGESIREVNIRSAAKDDSFFIDDAADANNSAYNTFDGRYVKAKAKDAVTAFGNYANYVVFEGLTDDRFVVTIKDGVPNINFNGLDLPSIAGIQIIGTYHPVDNIESSPSEAGGNDIISTGGGNDIVIGGAGSDNIATFGDIRAGIDDADTVVGDNGSVAVMYRSGWQTQDQEGIWLTRELPGQVIHARSSGFDPDVDLTGIAFDDVIFTGNGNDVVIGGDGSDKINTQSHDEIASDIWEYYTHDIPEVLKQQNLQALQNMETQDLNVISLNFSHTDPDPAKNNDLIVAPERYAGVVAAKNWNNVNLQDHLNPAQYPNPYTNSSFVTNRGQVADGLNLNIQAREDWGGDPVSLQADRSNGHDQINPDSENSRMFNSYYWAQKQQQVEININNIGDQTGFDVYDVYVYIDGDDERTEQDNYVFEISGGDIGNDKMNTFYLNDWRGHTFNGEFKEVTATTYELVNDGVKPNMEMVGNYVVFRDVTAKDFAVRIKNLRVGSQSPLNMPSIAGVQIVGGDMRTKVAGKGETGTIPRSGDYDKDVVVGDNGYVNFSIDVPYGVNVNPETAANKAYEVVSNGLDYSGSGQSDYIVTGKNQDLVIAGNGNDAIDSGEGHDSVIGGNAEVQMVDYNPVGVRQPSFPRILDNAGHDSQVYVGKPGTTENQFIEKLESGNVPGVKTVGSEKDGNNIIDGGRGNDLILGGEGNDVLIGNGGDDVIYDKGGSNIEKDNAYSSLEDYEADVADVLPLLDDNGVKVMREFMANDFARTSQIGYITAGLVRNPVRSYDLSGLNEVLVTVDAGEEITLISSNWPGKDDQWWNPDIALVFNGNGDFIPELQLSWEDSGSHTASVPSGQWYYRVSQIPDSPNDNGVYTITLKALSAGSFKVMLSV